MAAAADSATTKNDLLSREDVQNTPGADRTNSMAVITDNVPGAYMVHDMLHIRGGHQFSWLIDGVPVPNTNIASNVGPEVDPKDLDYVEVQRGSYDAAYGDRTYGVFNAVPRTGFERQEECEAVVSFGSYDQTNDQLNCGGHTQKFAYYGSVNGNRSNLGLETPVAQVMHDAANGYGGFGSLIYNVDAKNQLRLVFSARQDYFQIPNAGGIESQPFPYSPEASWWSRRWTAVYSSSRMRSGSPTRYINFFLGAHIQSQWAADRFFRSIISTVRTTTATRWTRPTR